MAAVLTCSTAPPASRALFSASEVLAAISVFFVTGTKLCARLAMSFSEVGSPFTPMSSCLIILLASSPDMPKFCITFGKLFRVSTRLTAPSMFEVTLLKTLDAIWLTVVSPTCHSPAITFDCFELLSIADSELLPIDSKSLLPAAPAIFIAWRIEVSFGPTLESSIWIFIIIAPILVLIADLLLF